MNKLMYMQLLYKQDYLPKDTDVLKFTVNCRSSTLEL